MRRSPSTAPASYTTPATALASRAGIKAPSRKSSLASAPNGDRNALADLYQATNGAQWRSHKNWLSDAPLGTWFGVTVDKTGRVTGLELDSNGLSGSIPPALGQLAHLQFLSLGSAQRPSAWGGMSALNQMMLSAKHSGGAPGMLAIGYPIPRGQWLTKLEVPSYAPTSNGLSGSIPPELGQLTRLQFLSLEDSSLSGQLSGAIPPALGQLTDLKCLLLGGNQLSGAIPSVLGQLPRLEYLSLGGNQLSGAVPSALGQLPRLECLSLEGNRLSGAVLSALGQHEPMTGDPGTDIAVAVLSVGMRVNTKQLSIWDRLFRQQKDKKWRVSPIYRYGGIHELWMQDSRRIDTRSKPPPTLRNT